MRVTIALAAVLTVLACLAAAEERALVLIDSAATEQTHSAFFSYLQDTLGIRLRFMQATSTNVNFMKYDQAKYDHLIIFAPTIDEFGGGIKSEDVIEFIDQGHNVLIATNSQSGAAAADIAALVGIEVDSAPAAVIDHFSNDGSSQLIKASQLIDSELIVGKKTGKPVLFRGIGLAADASNSLVIPILAGNPTSYSADPAKPVDSPIALGTKLLLVAGLQARNNARVVVSGSLDLFSNEFFENEIGSNKEFSEALGAWVFKFNGVLRISEPKHHLVGQTNAPREYTVGDELTYSVDIEERVNGKWVPFAGKDVQLEFVRIDPFVRTFLQNSNGHLHVTFKAPDVYGVFHFKIDYKRTGYTFIDSQTQAVVRPLLHTQYERFIPAAYPYYAGALSMVFGVFIFSFIFLYHRA